MPFSKGRRHFIRGGGAYTLFNGEITFGDMAAALLKGGQIRTMPLTEKIGFQTFLETHKKRAVPLFACDPDGKIFVFADGRFPEPETGWSLIYLLIHENKIQEPADE